MTTQEYHVLQSVHTHGATGLESNIDNIEKTRFRLRARLNIIEGEHISSFPLTIKPLEKERNLEGKIQLNLNVPI